MDQISIFSLVALFSTGFGQGVRISKTDFPRFVGVVACGPGTVTECQGAASGFTLSGLAGGVEIPDPTASELTTGGKVVLGFLEGKPFHWTRYAVEFPNSGWKWVVLNEVSVSDVNRVFLSLWKHDGSTLELAKILPRYYSLELGETFIHSSQPLPDGTRLVILKGEGSESGVRLQEYRFLRLTAPDRVEEVHRRVNRSEIPVEAIMEKLNADQPVEAVLDSTLSLEVGRTRAASGGPLIKFTMSRSRVLYTKNGPEETPDRKTSEEIDIWRQIKARR